MAILRLHELVHLYRDEIIRRCESKSTPQETADSKNPPVAAFLDQLLVELQDGASRANAISEVMAGGDAHISHLATASQVTQPYRGVGDSVVDLAMDLNVAISADDLVMLERCLDAAIANAVTEQVSRQRIASDKAVNPLQDLTDTAISAFAVLQTGTVGVMGRTGTLVLRSLMEIRALTAQPS